MRVEQGEWRSERVHLRETTFAYRVDTGLVSRRPRRRRGAPPDAFGEMQRWCKKEFGEPPEGWNTQVRGSAYGANGARTIAFMFHDFTHAMAFLMRFS